ncbi:hypothetical protein E0500_031090 [Streptomyces sp. KM273126]|uniref:hypothetical protein n=1 Tax=Streptomyces sp. KM273126 TaxID=2545247 RepID=UPI00103F2B5F|nr:hypothetical protein [Streptomyces sp. KM273126]MBA2811653.1 hypothetical protein [Streptomyces sp. KM273126]
MAVVQAAGADAWAWFRTRCARLVGRGDPERENEALDRLDRTAAALNGADEHDREGVRDEHARLWQGEFASLLESLQSEEQERFAAQLRALAREFGTAGGPVGGVMSGSTFNGPVNVQTGDHNHQEIHFGSAG